MKKLLFVIAMSYVMCSCTVPPEEFLPTSLSLYLSHPSSLIPEGTELSIICTADGVTTTSTVELSSNITWASIPYCSGSYTFGPLDIYDPLPDNLIEFTRSECVSTNLGLSDCEFTYTEEEIGIIQASFDLQCFVVPDGEALYIALGYCPGEYCAA